MDNLMILYMVSKKTLEVNPNHSIMPELRKKAAADKSDKTVKDFIWLLFDKSLLTSGFNLDGPTQVAGRIHRMIKLGLSIDDDDEGMGEDKEPLDVILKNGDLLNVSGLADGVSLRKCRCLFLRGRCDEFNASEKVDGVSFEDVAAEWVKLR